MKKSKLNSILVLSVYSLFTGILIITFDTLLHMAHFEDFRILNLFIYVLFLLAIFWTASFYRDMFMEKGYISYKQSFAVCFRIGFFAAVVIGIGRYVFLEYTGNVDLKAILETAKEHLAITHPWYGNTEVAQKLDLIEFSYKPIVSSFLYVLMYTFWALFFSFLSAFYIKRIDRTISDISE